MSPIARRAGIRALALCISACYGYSAQAVPFDLIVPKEVRVPTSKDHVTDVFHYVGPWGYVVSTEERITTDHLDHAEFTSSSDNPLVYSPYQDFFNTFTILPGRVRTRGDSRGAGILDPFIRPEEEPTVSTTNFWSYQLAVRRNYEGEALITHSVVMGDEEVGYHVARYTTLFRLSPDFPGLSPSFVAGQRVTAVPEPNGLLVSAVSLFTAGLARWWTLRRPCSVDPALAGPRPARSGA